MSKYFNDNFRPKLENNRKSLLLDFFQLPIVKNYDLLEEKYSNKRKQVSKEKGFSFFNLFKYIILPLSFLCLIFPFYFAWQKYKIMKLERDKLFQEFELIKNEKLEIHKEILDLDFFQEMYERMYSILDFKTHGPISQEFLKLLSSYTIFNLECDENNNVWNSSWGIQGKNKIVITNGNQNHQIIQQAYHGEKTVTRDKKTYTIHVTYYHPRPIITFQSTRHLFIKECPDLEFNFIKDYSTSLFKKRISKTSNQLENKDFEKNFKWNFNNEAQFRMLFTPLMQEMYLDEVKNSKEQNQAQPEDRYYKKSSFLSNEYIKQPKGVDFFEIPIVKNFLKTNSNNSHYESKYSDFYDQINSIFNKFLNDADYFISQMINDFAEAIEDEVFSDYKSMKFIYNIPFCQSINDKILIKKCSEIKNQFNNQSAFYIISNIISHHPFVVDTKPFYSILKSEEYNKIQITTIKILTYKRYEKVTSVYKDGEHVDVKYYDYKPITKFMNLYYTSIEQKEQTYYPHISGNYNRKWNISYDEILKMINSHQEKHNISTYIQDGFISCWDQDDNNFLEHIQHIKKIKDFYENQKRLN